MVVSCGAAGLGPRRVEQPLAVADAKGLRYTVYSRPRVGLTVKPWIC